jgi:hypothetical protein
MKNICSNQRGWGPRLYKTYKRADPVNTDSINQAKGTLSLAHSYPWNKQQCRASYKIDSGDGVMKCAA